MKYQYQPYNLNLLTEESRRQKHELYVSCGKLAGTLLIYNALNSVFSYLFYYVSYFVLAKKFTFSMDKIVNYLVDQHSEVVYSTAYQMLGNISITAFSLLITAIFVRFVFHLDLGGFLKPNLKGVKTGFVWMPGCFIINMIVSLAVAYFTSFLGQAGISVPSADFSLSSPSAASIIMQFAYVIIIGPIFEELIYRGIILGVLSKYGNTAAVLFSALAFGLMHGNIPQAVSAFATGLVYAIIAVQCQSVVPTIIIHQLNNFLANIPDIASSLGIPYYELAYSILEIAIALIGFLVLFTKYDFLKYNENTSQLDKKTVNKTVFTNPVVLLYFVVLLLSMISDLISANS